MKRTNQLIFILIVLIIALGSAIYFRSQDVQQNTLTPEIAQAPIQQPIKKSIIHYPIPEQTTTAADSQTEQPSNNAVDQTADSSSNSAPADALPEDQKISQNVELSLVSLLKSNSLPQLFILDSFVQRFVATVDNLPEKKLPPNQLPIRPPNGKFIVSGTQKEPQTSSRNNQRYTPYVEILQSIKPELAVKIYTHFYSSFQKAYEQLGYKNAYFNDRLAFVLDHLLETPNPADPLSLVQPVVFYTYANPDYENMSAGQKLLLRIGQKNRSIVLDILQQYRELITGQKHG